jgi:hypothetical protein
VNDIAISTLDYQSYICTVAIENSATDPSEDTTNWVIFISRGTTGPTGASGPPPSYNYRGTWSNPGAYVVNDIVMSPVDFQSYICTVAIENSATDPSEDTTNWVIFISRGPTGASGPIGSTGPTGPRTYKSGLSSTPDGLSTIVYESQFEYTPNITATVLGSSPGVITVDKVNISSFDAYGWTLGGVANQNDFSWIGLF